MEKSKIIQEDILLHKKSFHANDVYTTIVNIKTKHYPFSTSTEHMNLA